MKAALAAALALAPALARACPVCARGEADAALVVAAVAGMIAAPYLVTAVVIRAIRAGGGEP